jgi:hypothetical protein
MPFNAWLGDELARAGLPDEAIAVYRHVGLHGVWTSDTNSKPFLMHSTLSFVAVLKARGLDEEAQPTLERVHEYVTTMRRHGASSAAIHVASAKALALLGRPDEALEQIRIAVERPDAVRAFRWMEGDAAFAEVARDPRVEAVMKQLRDQQQAARARLPETFRRRELNWPWP